MDFQGISRHFEMSFSGTLPTPLCVCPAVFFIIISGFLIDFGLIRACFWVDFCSILSRFWLDGSDFFFNRFHLKHFLAAFKHCQYFDEKYWKLLLEFWRRFLAKPGQAKARQGQARPGQAMPARPAQARLGQARPGQDRPGQPGQATTYILCKLDANWW